MSEGVKKWLKIALPPTIFLFIFLWFYLLCLNHVDVNEIGVAYNSIGGEITVQKHPGWYVTSPMVSVTYLNTLPIRVTIPSEAKIINMRLVRFKPEGISEFINLQGFSYTLNSSLENILLGYAFSGRTYSFLEIIQEPVQDK